MKIINCGRVIYVICGNHIATIVYDNANGQASATIYYDGTLGEIVEAENGQTLRYAVKLARWTVRQEAHIDSIQPEWIATLVKRRVYTER